MPLKVNSIDSGITSAVISAARMLPRKANSTATTSSAPSTRFFCTVRIALSTRVVRSYTVTALTPGGRLLLMAAICRSTARETLRLFSPISMNTVPSTHLPAVLRGGTGAQLAPELDAGEVADPDGLAGGRADEDLGPVHRAIAPARARCTRYCSPRRSM